MTSKKPTLTTAYFSTILCKEFVISFFLLFVFKYIHKFYTEVYHIVIQMLSEESADTEGIKIKKETGQNIKFLIRKIVSFQKYYLFQNHSFRVVRSDKFIPYILLLTLEKLFSIWKITFICWITSILKTLKIVASFLFGYTVPETFCYCFALSSSLGF